MRQAFSRGQMVFDLPPTIIKMMPKGAKLSKHYRWPPMPFTVSSKQLANLVNTVPGVRAVHDVPMPKGRGLLFGAVVPTSGASDPSSRSGAPTRCWNSTDCVSPEHRCGMSAQGPEFPHNLVSRVVAPDLVTVAS